MIKKLNNFMVRTVMVGDQHVGKTSISKKMINDTIIIKESPTVGVDFFTLNIIVNNSNVKMQIWDTSGDQRFFNLTKLYLKNNAICYVVYDVCNSTSFKNAKKWIDEIKDNSINLHVIIVIVANKIDHNKSRTVTYEQGRKFAQNYNALYFEVSSKMSIGIHRLIEEPLERLFDMYDKKLIMSSDASGLKKINYDKEHLNCKSKLCCCIQ